MKDYRKIISNAHWAINGLNDTTPFGAKAKEYLSELVEMVKEHYGHPKVVAKYNELGKAIIWAIDNDVRFVAQETGGWISISNDDIVRLNNLYTCRLLAHEDTPMGTKVNFQLNSDTRADGELIGVSIDGEKACVKYNDGEYGFTIYWVPTDTVLIKEDQDATRDGM